VITGPSAFTERTISPESVLIIVSEFKTVYAAKFNILVDSS
jgi:hypothetical protein